MQKYSADEGKGSKERSFRELLRAEMMDFFEKNTGLTRAAAVNLERELEDRSALVMGTSNENPFLRMRMTWGLLPQVTVNGNPKRAVPLLVEEASVVAGVSNIVKGAVKHGGFRSTASGTITAGHVQVTGVPEGRIADAMEKIRENADNLIRIANTGEDGKQHVHSKALTIEPRVIDTERGKQIIVRFEVETGDGQGAGVVTKMGESMMPELARVTKGYAAVAILSNLPLKRVVVCEATFDKESLKWVDKKKGKTMEGSEVIEHILDLQAWAKVDQERATTHNKGIMNGITAVANALLQDTRAIEAGAHSYAAYGRAYAPLSSFRKDEDGNLVGRLEVPIAVGTVGGAFGANPAVKQFFLEIMGCQTAKEAAEVMAAVGLAQNVAALRMLVTFGVSAGHGDKQASMLRASGA